MDHDCDTNAILPRIDDLTALSVNRKNQSVFESGLRLILHGCGLADATLSATIGARYMETVPVARSHEMFHQGKRRVQRYRLDLKSTGASKLSMR